MDHINAYALAELNAGVREFTDRVYHWEQVPINHKLGWEYIATTADTPGDTAIRVRKNGYSSARVVTVSVPYVAGREFHRETPPNVLVEAVEDWQSTSTKLDIGRLVGVTDRHMQAHWHPDQWQKCSGVYTNGVRVVQKHLVPPAHPAVSKAGKCKLCLAAYRYIRKQIGHMAAGSTLPTLYGGMLHPQLSKAHAVAYQHPIKPYTVYRADWRKENNK